MKTLLSLILAAVLFTPAVFASPKHTADTVAVPRATLQAIDAKAKKIELELDAAKEETHAAQNSEADALSALRDAQVKSADLQKAIDAQAAEKQQAEKDRDAARHERDGYKLEVAHKDKVIFWLTLPLALVCAAFLFHVLWTLKIYELPLPYFLGPIINFGSPVLLFSAVMLVLRFI